jgi:hypothetical protein
MVRRLTVLLLLASACGPPSEGIPADVAIDVVGEALVLEDRYQEGSLLFGASPEVEREGDGLRVTLNAPPHHGIRLPVYSCHVDDETGEATGCTITHPFGWLPDGSARDCVKAPLPDGRQVIRCVGQCAKQGDPCPTPSPNNHSLCTLTNQSMSVWYCLYICDAQGKTYACPDPATQDCVQSVTAGIKICKPQ